MIRLIVDEYCQKCPEFEAKVDKDFKQVSMFDPMAIGHEELSIFTDTTISCVHQDRCRCMMETLRKDRI